MRAPVGPQLGKVWPQMDLSWARLEPIWECCVGVVQLQCAFPMRQDK